MEQAFNEMAQALEQRVIEHSAQLEILRKEQDAFSCAVSHDLHAPLRAIHEISRILCEECAAALPPKAAHYLQRVRQNAQRMIQMIDGLLAFSRVARHDLHKRLVSLGPLVEQVWRELHVQYAHRQVVLILSEMPPCHADQALCKQAFTYLLDNALKFTRSREDARIEIGCATIAAPHVDFIKENGVGFDLRSATTLFTMFHKLHSTEEYEGVGANLAITRRIVQRHEGRIWVEAEVDNGTTFFFTLAREA